MSVLHFFDSELLRDDAYSVFAANMSVAEPHLLETNDTVNANY